MTTRSDLGIYNNVAVTALYRYTYNEELKPALFHAVASAIDQHPVLSAVPMATDTTSPYFVSLSKINLEDVLVFIQMDSAFMEDTGQSFQLPQFLEEQHNTPFRYTTPLTPFWRLHVIEEAGNRTHFTLSFIFHHCIADTKSAMVFHEAIEAALAHPVAGKASTHVVTSHRVLLPPLDELLPGRNEEFTPGRTDEPATAWTGGLQLVPAVTHFTSLRLSRTDTTQLQVAAKRNSVTVTAALQAMLVAATFAQLPQNYTTLLVDCAISVRPWLPDPITATSMGCFVDNFSESYRRGPFSWVEAQRTRKKIDEVVHMRHGDNLCAKVGTIPDLKLWFGQKMGKPRRSALEISNIGILKPTTLARGCHIEGVLFSQAAGACSGAIKISAVTGRDGRLSLGFSWQNGVVEDNMVRGIVESFHAILLEVQVTDGNIMPWK